MIKLKNKKTGQVVTKDQKGADAILNNKIFGADWSVIEVKKDAPTPKEAIKVSIAEPVIEPVPNKTIKGKK